MTMASCDMQAVSTAAVPGDIAHFQEIQDVFTAWQSICVHILNGWIPTNSMQRLPLPTVIVVAQINNCFQTSVITTVITHHHIVQNVVTDRKLQPRRLLMLRHFLEHVPAWFRLNPLAVVYVC